MKRISAFLLAMVLIFSLACAKAEIIFDEDFGYSIDLYKDGLVGRQDVMVVQNKAYALYSNGDIYCWDGEERTYSYFAKVDAVPAVDIEKPLSKQNEKKQAELRNCVFSLLSDGEQLYGFNTISGKVGVITADGITWNEVPLDVSVINQKNQKDSTYPICVNNSFIYNNQMIATYDMSDTTDKDDYAPVILQFDLSTGACTVTDYPKVITMCHYQDDTMLVLEDQGTTVPTFTLYNLTTGESTPLGMDAPFTIDRKLLASRYDILDNLGGIAYDTVTDTIYIATRDNLWISTAGEAFQAATMTDQPWEYMNASGEAWVMPNGTYVFRNGSAYIY
ncbi:MAG: hypothetical protein Q4B32_09880 [Clostridia bacterium]|nr:hypothetical protein [Clostridia bacterium]